MIDDSEITGSASTTATTEAINITIPNARHLPFFIPRSPKMPARSIRTPTVADAIAPTSSAMIALIAEMGEKIPQMM